MNPTSSETKEKKNSGISINDLPEIAVLNREIERFKKMMIQNPTHEEEESYRVVAERHFLNGLERAKEVLFLSHIELDAAKQPIHPQIAI
jgi:hypothetical protein